MTAIKNNREIAEKILGPIRWESEVIGFCQCPGHNLHTTSKKKKDCRVNLDGVPTAHCFHESCQEEINEKNRELRDALNENQTPSYKMSKIEQLHNENMVLLKKRAANSLSRILSENPWPLPQIEEHRPQIPEAEETKVFLDAMFAPEDIIWIGDNHHSGPEHGKGHFQNREGWKGGAIAGPLICPNTFKLESVSRSNENIEKLKHLLVESDKLNKNQTGSIFRWLDQKAGLKLKAIVDSGNKSLHGWFEYPEDPDQLEDLKVILPALGCDPKMFTPSQPARLPGVLRPDTKKRQRLLYLATLNQGASV